MHRAIETRQHTPATDNSKRLKHSLRFLPNFLQMQVSTAYDLMRSDGDGVWGKFKAGIRQKVLHGISEAVRKEKESKKIYESIRKELWWEFMHEPREKDGKARY